MNIAKVLLTLASFPLAITSVKANEAVQDVTGTAVFLYMSQGASSTNSAGDYSKYNTDSYLLDGSLIVPVENFKYVGIAVNVHRENDYSKDVYQSTDPNLPTKGRGIGRSTAVSFDTFLRNPDVGGALIGYSYLDLYSKVNYQYSGFSNTQANSIYLNTGYLIGQYYFDDVTM